MSLIQLVRERCQRSFRGTYFLCGNHPRSQHNLGFGSRILANNGNPRTQIEDCNNIVHPLIQIYSDEVEVMSTGRVEQQADEYLTVKVSGNQIYRF